MLLHDVADPWMEISNMGLYLDNNIIPTVAFYIHSGIYLYQKLAFPSLYHS